ncbi:MAG: elongation factor P [Candidatus Paceibacterota bacterium]|jgi:elongation factor P
MLEYNEVTLRKYVVFEGEPYEVLASHVFRKQQRKPVNAVKMRNMITGRIVEHSYHVSDKAEEAELGRREIKYLYTNKGEFWFCEISDPSKRFQLNAEMIGDGVKFLKTNSVVDALIFDDRIIGVKLPIKVELKVTEAADAVKGNTVQGGTKSIKLETGAEIQAPMFIKQGEIIRVNTETGEYVERVN